MLHCDLQRSWVLNSRKCEYQRRKAYTIYRVQEPRFPNQIHYCSRSVSIFALARMIEGHSEIFLDSHGYIEGIEVQRDGQPRIHIFEIFWLRFNKRFDLHRNTRDRGCPTAMFQSMENENTTCKTLMFGCGILASLTSEKNGHILRLEYSTRAVLILEAGMESCARHGVYAQRGSTLSKTARPQE